MAEVDVKNKKIFCRSIHLDVSCKKGALKYLAKPAGKQVYRAFFFLKKKKKRNLGCKPAALFKKKLMHKFFSVNFLNFFRTAFL